MTESVNREALGALHRYYIWSIALKAEFESAMRPPPAYDPDSAFAMPVYALMSHWYGALYVVVEGYQELGLSDVAIDRLLASPNLDLLKRYRNGTFHFQRRYFDHRFGGLVQQGEDVVRWVHTLSEEFGRFLLDTVVARLEADG